MRERVFIILKTISVEVAFCCRYKSEQLPARRHSFVALSNETAKHFGIYSRHCFAHCQIEFGVVNFVMLQSAKSIISNEKFIVLFSALNYEKTQSIQALGHHENFHSSK